MSFEHECLNCGRRFIGRPNKVFCSESCKNHLKYVRRRARELERRYSHAQRQMELARLRGNRALVHLHRYRQKMLSAELDALEQSAVTTG